MESDDDSEITFWRYAAGFGSSFSEADQLCIDCAVNSSV